MITPPPHQRTENTQPADLRPSAEIGLQGQPCRFCGAPLERLVIDLGLSPLCQNHIDRESLNSGESFYPLRAYLCEQCLLVQVHEHVSGEEIFSHYAYFSSYSDSWLEHAREYCRRMIDRLRLNQDSFVVEVASNDGYLLRNFVEAGIPCLGIEPAANVAAEARARGIPVLTEFFGVDVARSVIQHHRPADLVIANNVLAHVPDLNDFVGGLKILLAEQGTLTAEFPHLKNLIEQNQFDTIYQEHYCYFSLLALDQVMRAHGLEIHDVEVLATHGGSLRIHVKHLENRDIAVKPKVGEIIDQEKQAGLDRFETYQHFQQRANEVKYRLLEFLIDIKRRNKTICGYGAPGKGNTLLNFCGIREDLLPWTVDRNRFKQNRFLPGSRIPIHAPDWIDRVQPDYVLILPWNLTDEIVSQLQHIRQWGGRFVVPIPELRIL